jgi:ribonucleoside-diphosphate reductase alpha chain
MGLHSFFQANNIPWEGVTAKSWNKKIFNHIKEAVDKSSQDLAEIKGACPDAEEYGIKERFSNKTAVAPTASISIICGGASPGIEPIAANVYSHKTLSGTFTVRNANLKKLLIEKGQDNDEVWISILNNRGSVQHLDFLTDHEKDVFKTAIEIDQRWLIDLAADRTEMIDQAQSLNVFVPADSDKKYIHDIHYSAWKKGVKSLYYCRSQSIQRAETGSSDDVKSKEDIQLPDEDKKIEKKGKTLDEMVAESSINDDDYDECLSCQ